MISAIDTIMEPVSKYIDFHIKPLTQLNSNFILVTMDVEALYANIDHSDRLFALKHYLQKRPDRQNPPSDFIVKLTRWTLDNNFFLF